MRQNRGVITLKHLERLGFSYEEVRGLVTHGDLRRLHRGVYADARAPLKDDAYFKAALLAVRGEPWLPSRAAAMAWGLTASSLVNIEVAVVATSTPKRPGLRIRRVSKRPHPSEIKTIRGLRVSSIPLLLIEVAADGGTQDELDALIEAAVRKDRLDVADLAATIDRNQRRPGVPRLRQTCAEYLPYQDRKSGLERSFDRWLAKHPEIPVPQRNITMGPFEIDCFWPEHSLALELDGRAYHSLMEEMERDHRKNTYLQLRGYRFLRVTDRRWKRDKAGAHEDLMALLALGQHDDRQAA